MGLKATYPILSPGIARSFEKELARKDGIFAEITSAAVLSGLDKLVKQKIILPDENVLLPITGFGLKDPPKDLFN